MLSPEENLEKWEDDIGAVVAGSRDPAANPTNNKISVVTNTDSTETTHELFPSFEREEIGILYGIMIL